MTDAKTVKPGMADTGETGKRQLARSVLSSWGGQVIVIISGFLIPRLIDRGLGQETLGVWDFAWSLISHFSLIQAGVTGSVNRYVALYRSRGDTDGLNRAVSSIAGVLRVMGAAVLLLTVLCVWGMPMLLRASLQHHLVEARWLVLLLGCSLAVQVTASVYGGILTGCHRWDWHNGVYAVTYAVMLGGMIVALKLGYGLVGLACVNLGSETLGRLVRLFLARRVCPEVDISRRHMSWGIAREMMGFGGKMFIYDCAYLLLTQTISLLVLTFLGPATLALFSRPVALVRTVKTFMLKYSNVFVPTASSLQATGDRAALCKLAVDAARYGAFFALPPMLFLIIHGGNVLNIWMGGAYANASLIASLVIAHFFSIAHAPMFSILAGLNQHGRAGLAIFCAAAVSALATFIWLGVFRGGILGVTVCLGIPWLLANGLLLPWFVARRLSMSLGKLLWGTWRQPLLYCVPYALGLLVVRYFYFGSALHTLLWSVLLGVGLLTVCYWFFVFPQAWRNKLLKRILPVPAKAP